MEPTRKQRFTLDPLVHTLADEATTEAAQRIADDVMAQREEILRAFVAKYGFDPKEAEQVVQHRDGHTAWFVRRRRPGPDEHDGQDIPPPMKLRYVVIPGRVRSRNDGDWHYVGAGRLMQLYGVAPAECLILEHQRQRVLGLEPGFQSSLVPLRPRADGRYDLILACKEHRARQRQCEAEQGRIHD